MSFDAHYEDANGDPQCYRTTGTVVSVVGFGEALAVRYDDDSVTRFAQVAHDNIRHVDLIEEIGLLNDGRTEHGSTADLPPSSTPTGQQPSDGSGGNTPRDDVLDLPM